MTRLMPASLIAVLFVGCNSGFFQPVAQRSATIAAVASKAASIASMVGGVDGFGSNAMTGYTSHMPGAMGFYSQANMASETGELMVRLENQWHTDATFHLSYLASHMGLEYILQDVNVAAGESITMTLPCAEIVGLGPLVNPGEPGCHLNDGEAVANTMAVPGLLGQDFSCGDVYTCILTQDIDDLDDDGDLEELILLSDAMTSHLANGGPQGHAHGTEYGMMGSHMGF